MASEAAPNGQSNLARGNGSKLILGIEARAKIFPASKLLLCQIVLEQSGVEVDIVLIMCGALLAYT